MTASPTGAGPIETYIREVLQIIPRPLPERARIDMELRSHLAEQLDAGVTPEEAVRRMGTAEAVAREYLGEVELHEASIMRRTGAFLIDLGIGAILLAPVWVGIWILVNRSMGMDFIPILFLPFAIVVSAAMVAVPILSVVYFPVLEAVYGQTVGKRALGIYVVREGGEAAGWGPAILRRLPFFLEIFWIDALFALFTRRRQRAFDLVARTVVVRQ